MHTGRLIKKFFTTFICALLLLSTACATQHETTGSSIVGGTEQIESLVVFAISSSAAERSEIEETFSLAMRGKGVPTQPTYTHLSTLDTLEDEDAVIAMYRDTGANMGLTIESLKTQSEAAQKAQVAMFGTWLAGLVLDDPTLRRAGAVGGLAAYGQAGKYQLRISLWDAADGELQWTMDTRSFTNQDTRQDAERLAEVVHQELKSKGLLP